VATYIVLCTFDRAGVDELVGPHGDVTKKAQALMEHVGGSIDSMWLTTGGFDMVLVVEASNPGKAVSFLAAFSSVGGVSTQTLAATKDVTKVLKAALAAKSGFGEAKSGFGAGDQG
jgi:uncharacterized protein with GYD domain